MKKTFFICGPPKCASSTLYHHLKRHPEIEMSRVKETRYFSHVSQVDLDRYFEEFFSRDHAGQCRGEATPTYSFLPFVADALKRHFPNPKFIFSFRHPVERAYSGWLMRKQLGHEDLDFIDALKANRDQNVDFSGPSFKRSWQEEHNSWRRTKRRNIIRTYIGEIMPLFGAVMWIFLARNHVRKYTQKNSIKICSPVCKKYAFFLG